MKKRILQSIAALMFAVITVCSFAGCGSRIVTLEGDIIKFEDTGGVDPPSTGFHSACRINRSVPDTGKFPVELSFGARCASEYASKEQKHVDIVVYERGDDHTVIKKISGKKFFTDEYLCYPNEQGMHFNHTEMIEIPVKILTQAEGWFYIEVAAHDDKYGIIGGAWIKIQYFKEEQKINFDGRIVE